MNEDSLFNLLGMSKEEWKKQSEQREKDHDYFEKNIDMLRRENPDEWVAIYNQERVGHDKNYQRLMSQLEKDGIKNPYVAYISSKPILWTLPKLSFSSV